MAQDQAWSQSAKSWVSFAARDYQAALMLGRCGVQLDPNDGAVLDLMGAVAPFFGEIEEAVDQFEAAKQFDDPLNAPSLGYATAALSAFGREHEARAKLAELERAWPEAPNEIMLKSIHSDDAHADEVISELVLLGWTSTSPQASSNP
ncbi:hypothetical protein [Ruegeria lacuscaerulensis]|uniref:hypothetical protein n=1 Tax=Ruegeria lacuscaerulensis TaxID=55218 RepID=UPI00147AAA80|nr:hypothetical protein [Ruegeria lacuscaerulensis]